MRSFKKYYGNIFFGFLLLILATIHIYQHNKLAYSGDEPRFTYYSYSIVKGQMLQYPLEKFVKETDSMMPAHTIKEGHISFNIFNKQMFMMNSIVAPLMYAPILYIGTHKQAWVMLRTSAFLYYCCALIFIWLSLKTIFSTTESLVALSLTALSLPQLAQMSLGNTEQATIVFLSLTFYCLLFRSITIITIIIGTIAMCLTVWASMRSIPLAASLALGFVGRLLTMREESYSNKYRNLLIFLAVTVIGALGWIALQLSFTGTVSGSSLLNENITDKNPIWFIHRLFVPLLNHRNGIFALFPLVFAAFVGLINAARKRELIAWTFLLGWVMYYVLISWTDQSEGYPARLQFILIEFFVFGMAYFIRDFRNITGIVLLTLGAAIAFVSIPIHLHYPAVLLENRQFGLFQQLILSKTHILDLGQYIIWDQYSIFGTKMPTFFSDSWRIGYKVFSFLIILGILLIFSVSNIGTKIQKVISWCTLIFLLWGISTLFVMPISNKEVFLLRSVKPNSGILTMVFNKPVTGNIVVTFNMDPVWVVPKYPDYFTVIVKTEDGHLIEYQKRSIPEIRLPYLKDVDSIIIKNGNNVGAQWVKNMPVNAYVSLFPSIRQLFYD